MDPLDFIETANRLKNSCVEADRRSAVSRAYYAVFSYIKLYLEDNSIFISKNEVHVKLPRYLMNSGPPLAKIVGKSVDDLRGDRIEADYVFDQYGPDINTCEKLVDKAQEAIQNFNSCKGTALINGIKQYQKIDRGIS